MQKFNVKKVDFLSFFKPCLIALCCMLVVFGIIFGVFGFNKGFDFSGGTEIVVDFSLNSTADFDIEKQENFDYASSEIKKIFASNNADINSFQVAGEYKTKSFVITTSQKDVDTIRKIRLDINNKFNFTDTYTTLYDNNESEKILDSDLYNSFDLTRKSSSIDSMITSSTLLNTISTLLFAGVCCMIYGFFRLKASGAFSVFVGGLASVLLTLCFVCFARIQINTYFFVSLGLVELLGLYLATSTNFEIKRRLKDDKYNSLTTYEIANGVACDNFNKNLIICLFCVVASVLVGIFSVVNILRLTLVIFVGVVSAFVSNLIFVPSVFALTARTREVLKPKKQATNDKDQDASEIVVE